MTDRHELRSLLAQLQAKLPGTKTGQGKVREFQDVVTIRLVMIELDRGANYQRGGTYENQKKNQRQIRVQRGLTSIVDGIKELLPKMDEPVVEIVLIKHALPDRTFHVWSRDEKLDDVYKNKSWTNAYGEQKLHNWDVIEIRTCGAYA